MDKAFSLCETDIQIKEYPMNPLNHLAVIMDGNGRWANKRNHRRIFGHIRGARTAKELVEACLEKQIPYLSLFTFSEENRQRPKEEVILLFKLLEKALLKQSFLLKQHQIKLHTLGDLSCFPDNTVAFLNSLKEETKHHKGLNLILALNYGGQQEILNGVKALLIDIQKGNIQPENINKSLFEKYLSSQLFPPPDLIIRTGGELRISNFYLWSAAYSELYFTPVLWPDFTKTELEKALKQFAGTNRRFGKL